MLCAARFRHSFGFISKGIKSVIAGSRRFQCSSNIHYRYENPAPQRHDLKGTTKPSEADTNSAWAIQALAARLGNAMLGDLIVNQRVYTVSGKTT